jgi:alpha-glucoside transport system substrate-binding protein
MITKHRLVPALAVAGIAALGVAGCGSSNDDSAKTPASAPAPTSAPTSVTGKVSMVGVWTGDEQKSFQSVIDAFHAKYPGVTVKYTSAGDNTPTVLGTAVSGGSPPDVASVGQPALVKEFQQKGALKPISFASDTIKADFPPDFAKLGEINGTPYSFVFKAANKSTVWYNVAAFKTAGVTPPATWNDFLTDARTIKASGTPAYSIGGADGWTLTDLFENIYLRQAGPDKYDQLSTHAIPWTDPSVKTALTTMAQVLGDKSNIVGGTSGALQTDFPGSVENVFVDPAKGAQVIEGDFVPGVVASKTKLKPITGYNVYPFPAIGSGTSDVVGGGDSIIMFKNTPASQAFVEYLATAPAAQAWAKRGGFSSANKLVPASTYPDDITRTTATAIAKAKTFRFDMSDLAPVSFGGTPGQGEWKILEDFLQNPTNVDGTAQKLETAAAKAFKSESTTPKSN